MEMSHILSRTERGALELQTRSGQATRRQRAILLLVNGERSAAEILGQLGSAGPDENDLDQLLAEGYVLAQAPMHPDTQPKMPIRTAPAPAPSLAARHGRQASIADWRLSQAGAFSALQRYLAEGPGAPLDFLNGLAAPLYGALVTCRSEPSAHAVVVLLERTLASKQKNMIDAS